MASPISVNVGGFGHTGNTALVDHLADHGAIPLAKDFGETAIIRSNWGVSGALDSLAPTNSSDQYLDPEDLRAALVGDSSRLDRSPGGSFEVDLKRNARVRLQLGYAYKECVERLVECYLEAVAESRKDSRRVAYEQFNTEAHDFLHKVKVNAQKKASPEARKRPIVFRNDPAAYGIKKAELASFHRFFIVVRDPLDVAADWLAFYKHKIDQDGIDKFTRQFLLKIRRFGEAWATLERDVIDSVRIVRFESLVQDEAVRRLVLSECRMLGDESVSEKRRFQPEKSIRNIGISRDLDGAVREAIASKVCEPYEKFMASYGEHVIGD